MYEKYSANGVRIREIIIWDREICDAMKMYFQYLKQKQVFVRIMVLKDHNGEQIEDIERTK
jgi:hypothetical protein